MFDFSFEEKQSQMNEILDNLHSNVGGILGSSIVSIEGLPIAKKLPEGLEDTLVAALTAAMLSLGEKIATTLSKGSLDKILVGGAHGVVVTMSAGPNAVLTVSADNEAKEGIIYYEMREATKKIASILEN
ncbi:MAG: roadblock/LC7 domain-containing protein [Candidatus Heimdallarchaeota archaeon]|nr:roadblock/LC7 domain-containing protein [Candidatus Heimdallarchaeota archaeon]